MKNIYEIGLTLKNIGKTRSHRCKSQRVTPRSSPSFKQVPPNVRRPNKTRQRNRKPTQPHHRKSQSIRKQKPQRNASHGSTRQKTVRQNPSFLSQTTQRFLACLKRRLRILQKESGKTRRKCEEGVGAKEGQAWMLLRVPIREQFAAMPDWAQGTF